MKKGHIYIIFAISIVFGTLFYYAKYNDSLTDDYFSKLLGLEKAVINDVCIDNDLSVFGDGIAVEEYKLSDETFSLFEDEFRKKSNLLSKSNYLKKYESSIEWKTTPIDFDLSSRFDISDVLAKNDKCFNEKTLIKLLNEEGNYYSSYYSSSDYFTFFVINSKTKSIYVIQRTF